MKRLVLLEVVACLLLAGLVGRSEAVVVFYVNDAAGFAAAMSGNTLIGVEDFEGSTLPPNTVVGLPDPLTQGVANGPYPAGLVQPLTVQSNLLGGNPVTPTPRGLDGLAAASAGFGGNISDVVVANYFVDSLDLIFSPTDTVAGVGFNPLNFYGSALLEVRVYDTGNVLLGTGAITGDEGGTNFLGIAATGGDLIGRINLFSTSDGAEGGDNIQIYKAGGGGVIPEPSTYLLFGVGALGLVAWRRRRAV